MVETPTKMKTITRLFKQIAPEQEVCVKATLGYLRDLPSNEMGIDIRMNGSRIPHYDPIYVFLKGKKKLVSNLHKIKYEQLIIATDNDSDGEITAWHLQQVLGNTCKRLILNELTVEALGKGMANLYNDVDLQKCTAQQTRRLIDRVIGFRLGKGINMPIGRIQLAALSIIAQVVCEPHYRQTIEGYFTINDVLYKLHTSARREAVAFNCDHASIIKSFEKRVRKINPPEPYTTASLLRDAINQLGVDASQVMLCLQSLYENGYITYYKTEKSCLSAEYASRNGVQIDNMCEYGNECLRPCAVEAAFDDEKEHVKHRLGKMGFALYNIICKRTSDVFKPSRDVSEGWLVVEHQGCEFTVCTSALADASISINRDQPMCKKIIVREESTPFRYLDESTLLQMLTEKGIGKPYILGSIVQKLVYKKYVSIVKPGEYNVAYTIYTPDNVQHEQHEVEVKKARNNSIVLTDLGRDVLQTYRALYPQLVDVDYVSHLEHILDQGDFERDKIIQGIWDLL